MIGVLALSCIAASGLAGEEPDCAKDIAGLRRLLRDPAFPLRWIETAMKDGKPMVLTVEEQAGALHWRFVKTGDGLWAAGTAALCLEGTRLHARMRPGQMESGPAANWLARQAMLHGATLEIRRPQSEVLTVSATGWRGEFAPAR